MRRGAKLMVLAAMLLGAPAAPQAAPLPAIALAGPAPTLHRVIWPFGRLFGGRRHARRHGHHRGGRVYGRRMRAGRADQGSAQGGGQGSGGTSGAQKLRFQ